MRKKEDGVMKMEMRRRVMTWRSGRAEEISSTDQQNSKNKNKEKIVPKKNCVRHGCVVRVVTGYIPISNMPVLEVESPPRVRPVGGP